MYGSATVWPIFLSVAGTVRLLLRSMLLLGLATVPVWAADVPPRLLGKSVTIAFKATIEFQGPDGSVRSGVRQSKRTISISSKGRTFSRTERQERAYQETVERGPGETGLQFEGRALLGTIPFQSGASQLVATFDKDFGTCTATVFPWKRSVLSMWSVIRSRRDVCTSSLSTLRRYRVFYPAQDDRWEPGMSGDVQSRWRRHWGLALVLLLWVLATGEALAQQRVALVIGNSNYSRAPRLPNPANDAQDMAERLKSLGFKVVLRLDAGKASLDGALVEFARASTAADIALFFYAGHGMQYQGRNYLFPVDAKIEDDLDVRYQLLALDDVRAAFDRVPGARLMILDACRDNPLADSFNRSVAGASRNAATSRGLARVSQSGGSLVAYATQADTVASDGTGRNSPFTRALLTHLADQGVEIGTLFRRVAATVNRETGGRQTPEVSISLLSEVYLNPEADDAMAWRSTQYSQSRADYESFLARFPQSGFAGAARAQLARLSDPSPAPEKAPASPPAPQDAAQAGPPAPVTPASSPAPPVPPAKVAALAPEPSAAQLTSGIFSELQRIGCYAGPLSVTWTSREAQKALGAFARQDRSRVPSDPSTAFLEALKLKADAFCRPACAKGTVERDGRCVAIKPAPAVANARAPKAEPTGAPAPARAAPNSRCFVFQGKQYCE